MCVCVCVGVVVREPVCMCVHVPECKQMLVNNSGLGGNDCADMPTCRGAVEILWLLLLLILFAWLLHVLPYSLLTTRSRSVCALFISAD